MGIELPAFMGEGDRIHLYTDGTDAADVVREALGEVGLSFTQSSFSNWPEDWGHPILNVRIEALSFDTTYRGQGTIMFFFVPTIKAIQDGAVPLSFMPKP